VDGVKINLVDIIGWNSEDRINHFKVMVRPLKAINLLHQRWASYSPPPVRETEVEEAGEPNTAVC